jgi:hypothetical protein
MSICIYTLLTRPLIIQCSRTLNNEPQSHPSHPNHQQNAIRGNLTFRLVPDDSFDLEVKNKNHAVPESISGWLWNYLISSSKGMAFTGANVCLRFAVWLTLLPPRCCWWFFIRLPVGVISKLCTPFFAAAARRKLIRLKLAKEHQLHQEANALQAALDDQQVKMKPVKIAYESTWQSIDDVRFTTALIDESQTFFKAMLTINLPNELKRVNDLKTKVAFLRGKCGGTSDDLIVIEKPMRTVHWGVNTTHQIMNRFQLAELLAVESNDECEQKAKSEARSKVKVNLNVVVSKDDGVAGENVLQDVGLLMLEQHIADLKSKYETQQANFAKLKRSLDISIKGLIKLIRIGNTKKRANREFYNDIGDAFNKAKATAGDLERQVAELKEQLYTEHTYVVMTNNLDVEVKQKATVLGQHANAKVAFDVTDEPFNCKSAGMKNVFLIQAELTNDDGQVEETKDEETD